MASATMISRPGRAKTLRGLPPPPLPPLPPPPLPPRPPSMPLSLSSNFFRASSRSGGPWLPPRLPPPPPLPPPPLLPRRPPPLQGSCWLPPPPGSFQAIGLLHSALMPRPASRSGPRLRSCRHPCRGGAPVDLVVIVVRLPAPTCPPEAPPPRPRGHAGSRGDSRRRARRAAPSAAGSRGEAA